MPQYYRILDNGQSEDRRRNSARGVGTKKTMTTARANARTKEGREGLAQYRKFGRKGTRFFHANELRADVYRHEEEFRTAGHDALERERGRNTESGRKLARAYQNRTEEKGSGSQKAKVRRQKYAAASAGLQKAKARGTNIDASYVGRTIYKAKQRKAKQGNKR